MAQVVVTEAEPKVRQIITEEKAKLSEAGLATLPFLGASAAGFLATAILVPEDNKKLKFGGYMASTAATVPVPLAQTLERSIQCDARCRRSGCEWTCECWWR